EWLRGPRDGLFLAMESALGRLPIVAENLGVITAEVEALRLRHQVPGMIVLQFALADGAFRPQSIPAQCVCYTGTHDNDTSKGWFLGGQNDTRTAAELRATQQQVLGMTGGSATSIHIDLVRMAFTSRAHLAMAPMQDYLGLGSDSRMNIPGTTLNNWRWRLRADQLTATAAGQITRLIADSSRN
ncbi:MAG TPA: 4-alpha-glucanotransferase, partial [Xanthomonadales bacterium]|nr:4-alpha-glucanotransferase [Xanthomonadales bacterium]